MLTPDMLITMAASEVENPSLFPFPFKYYVIFVVVSILFFIFRFVTERKPYQLILTIAIACSMGLFLFEGSRSWYYAVAAVEAVLLLAALGSTFLFKDKSAPAEAESTEAESTEAESAETESTEE